MNNLFVGEADPREVTVVNIRPLDARGRDARLLRVGLEDATEAEGVVVTCVVPGSLSATAEEAAQAVANRLNLHYPPEARLVIAGERDRLGGEYYVEGRRDVGFLAGESALNVPA